MCTESDLSATKESAQSLARGVPTSKKVKIFQAVIDAAKEINEDLARDIRRLMRYLFRGISEAQAGKDSFQYWLDIIHLYPDAEKLRTRIEPSFQTNPELIAEWYRNIQPIAESFVR